MLISVGLSLDAETHGEGQALGRLVPTQFVIRRVVLLPASWEATIGLTISSRALLPLTEPRKYRRASTSQPSMDSAAILQSRATPHVARCSKLQRRVVAASCLLKRE